MSAAPYDAVVIGGGMAGVPLAHCLAYRAFVIIRV